MIKTASKSVGFSTILLAVMAGLLGSCATMAPMMGGQKIDLSGTAEVPPVTTSATGNATVDIKSDRSVTATVTVSGMTATASHIHEAAAGSNGPVIVPFVKSIFWAVKLLEMVTVAPVNCTTPWPGSKASSC